jgi:hypothetical protein
MMYGGDLALALLLHRDRLREAERARRLRRLAAASDAEDG